MSALKFKQVSFPSSVAPKEDSQLKRQQTEKPLKYYVTDYFAQPSQFERGINWQNGFGIPRKNINTSTDLRDAKQTRQMTNSSYELGALPLPTTPSLIHGGSIIDTQIEDSLRPKDDFHPKSSLPRDTHFYKRSFSIFEGLPVRPNGCVDNVVQINAGYRQGIDTRHIRSKKKK